MTKKTLAILLFLISADLTKVYAGWYECYNFKGTIDKYPITLSVQVRDGYFGETDKKSYNIIGVYKYDRHNEPIRLEGKINFKNNKALLYEIHDNKQAASLEFSFAKSHCNGIWRNFSTNTTMPLHLDYVSQLLDTLVESQFTKVEILQASSLADFYFVGEYSKVAGERSAQMDMLKIIQKKGNLLFQTIDFSNIETQAGNVSTIIYGNVGVVNAKTKKINVSNNIGRVGGFLTIHFNPNTRKFRLDPEPTIDGPD